MLVLAGALLAGGCATAGRHVPQPFPQVGGSGAALGWADPYRVTGTALSLRGVPYVWGGDSPDGFDCSGFTQYVYARHGIRLPRQAADQYQVGARVGRDDVRAGDLVFFTTIASGASHVGLALGDDQFVHAPSGARRGARGAAHRVVLVAAVGRRETGARRRSGRGRVKLSRGRRS